MVKLPTSMRVAGVEDDVPHELIDAAAHINFSAYSNTELDDKLKLLRSVVMEKLQHQIKPRTAAQRTTSARQIPGHIPDKLVALFNDFTYPEMNKMQRIFYKNALIAWIKVNLKTR